MALVEVEKCIFDEQQLGLSHGFETLNLVVREVFVNHLHIAGDDRHVVADRIIESWVAEMRSRWPSRAFRIYKQAEPHEVTIRFHLVRPGFLNWCEVGIEIILINAPAIDLPGDPA